VLGWARASDAHPVPVPAGGAARGATGAAAGCAGRGKRDGSTGFPHPGGAGLLPGLDARLVGIALDGAPGAAAIADSDAGVWDGDVT